MPKCIYLAHYGDYERRGASLPGIPVMEYIMECMEKTNAENYVVSPLRFTDGSYSPRSVENIAPNLKLIYTERKAKCPKWNILFRLVNLITDRKTLYHELLDMISDGDVLVVYHSLATMQIVRELKKHRKFTLIIQVCEVYGDALKNQFFKHCELEYFHIADKYIFQSEMLEQLINKQDKPYAILYGTYKAAPIYSGVEHNDGKIHCVYAGTLSKLKAGAYMAASAAKYLPDKFWIHILGSGDTEEVDAIQRFISKLSAECICNVTYDGTFLGEAYMKFLQSCKISLSTQNPAEDFNATSFPSKILVYMANGLNVVSSRISPVEISQLGPYIDYSDEYSAESIADTIQKVDVSAKRNNRDIIHMLDLKFFEDFKQLVR